MLTKNTDAINKKNLDVVAKYETELHCIKYSKKTIYEYRWVLEHFFSDCRKPIKDINYDDVLNWLDSYKVGKSARTVNPRLSALKGFFQYCKINNYIEKVPVKRSWYQTLNSPVPRFLDNMDLAKVEITAEEIPLTERALISFLLTSGVRVSEAAGLKKSNINLNKRTAIVFGKGKKERIVPFSEETAYLLKKLVDEHPNNTEYLFINRWKNPMTASNIQYLFRKFKEKVQLTKPFTPHVCRHTMATKLASHGMNIHTIQRLLGHEYLVTTQCYAHISDKRAEQEYRRVME